jgi:Mannosylglycerate hydrolase MGH1-like glycoside hydrolase domain
MMPLLDHLGMILSPARAPAQGDMIVRGVSGGWTTIRMGEDNQVLQVDPDTGLPVWSSQPIEGVTGPPGPHGPTGPTGLTGAQGPQGPPGGGVYHGPYDNAHPYIATDLCKGSNGLYYQNIVACTGVNPVTDTDESNWIPTTPKGVPNATGASADLVPVSDGAGAYIWKSAFMQPTGPPEVDMSWRSHTSGGGTVSSYRPNWGGMKSDDGAMKPKTTITIASGTDRAYVESGPLGIFDVTFHMNLTAITAANPTMLWTLRNPGAEFLDGIHGVWKMGDSLLAAFYSTADNKLKVLVPADGAWNWTYYAVTGLDISTPGTEFWWHIRRDFEGIIVELLSSEGGTAVHSGFVARHQESAIPAILHGGPLTLQIGERRGSDGSQGTFTMVIDRMKLERTPDNAGDLFATGLHDTRPARGATEFDDVVLATQMIAAWDINRMDKNALLPGESMEPRPWISDAFNPGSRFYANDYIWDHIMRATTFLRDMGGIELARNSINNFLYMAQEDGWVPALFGHDGALTSSGVAGVLAGAQRWVQAFLAQGIYYLAHDGDLSWVYGGESAAYSVLQDYITYLETNRQKADGLFVSRSPDENSIDGSYDWAGNDLTSQSTGIINTESPWFNGNIVEEYRAMAAIASQLGNTDDSVVYADKAETLRGAIQTLLYDSTVSWPKSRNSDTLAFDPRGHITAGNGAMFLFRRCATPAQAKQMRDRFMDSDQFLVPFGISELPQTDANFDPNGIYNGGCWEGTAYFAGMGLYRYGYYNDALDIQARWSRLWREQYKQLPAPGHYPHYGGVSEVGGCFDGNWTGYTDGFYGFCLGIRMWNELRNGYDPMQVFSTTTTKQNIGTYSR